MKFSDIIKEALFWIFIAISLFMLLWKIFGNSPTSDAVIMPILMALIINAWRTREDIGILKTRLYNFERQFSSLAKDFKEHLKIFNNFEKQFVDLNRNFSSLSKDFRIHIKKH